MSDIVTNEPRTTPVVKRVCTDREHIVNACKEVLNADSDKDFDSACRGLVNVLRYTQSQAWWARWPW